MKYFGYNEDTNEISRLGDFSNVTQVKDFLHFEAKTNYLIILNQDELDELAYQASGLASESA